MNLQGSIENLIDSLWTPVLVFDVTHLPSLHPPDSLFRVPVTVIVLQAQHQPSGYQSTQQHPGNCPVPIFLGQHQPNIIPVRQYKLNITRLSMQTKYYQYQAI